MVSPENFVLVSGSSHPALASSLAQEVALESMALDVKHFPSGEIHVQVPGSVRDRDVILLQTHTPPVNGNLVETFLAVDALRRASARSITLLAPFFPYARQDRKGLSREALSAAVVGSIYQALGVDRVVTLDLHASQIQGFFQGPFEHLSAFSVLSDAVASITGPLTIVTPDAGRVKLAERWADKLDASIAIVHKRRSTNGEVRAFEVVGAVEGRTCVIVDDMIDTAGTLVSAADAVLARDPLAIIAAATHGVFSEPSFKRLESSCISKVLVTDTLPQNAPSFVEVLSSLPVLSAALRSIMTGSSVSPLLKGSL